MYYDELRVLFKKYPNLKEEKSGLYRLLLYPYFREKYKISLEEAEYLAEVEITEGELSSPDTWARELVLFRERR